MFHASRFMFHSPAHRSGQVMVEAMVALGALTLGYLAILALLNQSLGLASTVSDRNTATYLAAEGIEIVRNLSDANVRIGPPAGGFARGFISGNFEVSPLTLLESSGNIPGFETDNDIRNPGKFLNSQGGGGGGGNPNTQAPQIFKFIKAVLAADPPPTAPNNAQFLRYDPNKGYNYTTGEPTRFKRFINISSSNLDVTIRVKSVVVWTGKNGLKDSVVMEDHFFNWR